MKNRAEDKKAYYFALTILFFGIAYLLFPKEILKGIGIFTDKIADLLTMIF